MKRLVITIVIILIIYYFYNKEQTNKNRYKSMIKPKLSHEIKKDQYNDITNFIYRIQTYYYYNPQTFEEIIKHLETFIILYKSVHLQPDIAGQYYDLMNDRKHMILNNLRSYFISLPVYKDQFNCNDALDDLEIILDKYLDEIIEINNKNNYKEITRDTKYINKKDLSHNRFLDNYASFSYY